MAKNITLMGADYPQVPAVQLPQTGGGTATFYDINVVDNLNSDSETDALSAKQGKILKEKIKKSHFRVIKTYNGVSIPSSGWVKIDDFGTIKNDHSNILTDAWYLGSINIRGWSGGIMPINIGKGSNGSDFYLMGVQQSGLNVTVEYFFINPEAVTDAT